MLDLGYDTAVLADSIVFILAASEANDAAIAAIAERAQCVRIAGTSVKSIVYTSDGQCEKLYFSPIKAATLFERANERIIHQA